MHLALRPTSEAPDRSTDESATCLPLGFTQNPAGAEPSPTYFDWFSISIR
jgi:hypothetical protein